MHEMTILILAAGSSSRMGKTKQLLPYKNTTLLGWTIQQAKASMANEVVCVLGANAKEIEASIKNDQLNIIYNVNYKKGLSSSIVKGISDLQDKEAILIMLADQPNITKVYLNKFLDSHIKYPNKIIASVYGTTFGVPALFPKRFYDELLKLEGDKGAKNFLNNHVEDIIKIDSIDLIDIDTPKDYQNLTN